MASPLAQCPTGAGGVPQEATLSGAVADSKIVTVSTLSALNQSIAEAATYLAGASPVTATYTDVTLWTLIRDAGLPPNSAIKNNLLDIAVVATGSDGYRAVISPGDITPIFGNQPDLVALPARTGSWSQAAATGHCA